MLRFLSASFLLLVLVIAAFVGAIAWLTADKVVVGGREGLDVIMYPDERLAETAGPVDNLSLEQERISRLIELMKNTMAKLDADSLSAPQVGVPERIIIIRTEMGLSLGGSEYACLINPRITAREGSSTGIDHCLSLPRGEWKIEVPRSETVTVAYTTPEGVEEETEWSGANARHIQHAMDHLDGIMVTGAAEGGRPNARLAAAIAIYLLAAVAAAGLYLRNRAAGRKRAP